MKTNQGALSSSLLVMCSLHPLNSSFKKNWQEKGGDIVYLNKYNTDRPYVKQLEKSNGTSYFKEIDLECPRLSIPFVKSKITLVGNLWAYTLKNNYRTIVTHDYLFSTLLKFICKVKNTKIYYYNESHGLQSSHSWIRNIINKFLLSGFDGYFHGCLGAKELAERHGYKSTFLPCMDLLMLDSRLREKQNAEDNSKEYKNQVNLMFVGHLSYKKGYDRLDKITNSIASYFYSSKYDRVNLTIVGTSPKPSEIIHTEFDKKISVRNYSYLSYDEVIENMLSTDFLILPSRYEPMGAVILEAIACGARIITTSSVGAFLEVQYSNSGIALNFENNGHISNDSLILLEEEIKRFKYNKTNNTCKLSELYNIKVANQALDNKNIFR